MYRRRRIVRIAHWRVRGGPIGKRLDLRGGQRWIIRELAEVWIGKPRRHLLRTRDLFDGAGIPACLFVGLERHRSHLAHAMTTLAVRLQNRENVAIKGRRGEAAKHGTAARKESKKYFKTTSYCLISLLGVPCRLGQRASRLCFMAA